MPAQGYPYPLAGKTVLVTGGSRGIGEGIVMELARRGAATVLFTYVSPGSEARAREICGAVRALPHAPAARAFRVDLGREDGPRALLVDILAAWGGIKEEAAGEGEEEERGERGGRGEEKGERGKGKDDEAFKLDVLVNNAGVERVGPLGDISVDDYNAVYDVNVRGVILLTQALLPHIPRRPTSRILNIGSVGARAGFAAMGLYCSSKAALEALTRCWAAELGEGGITVNCINPGPVQSALLDQVPGSIVAAQRAATPLGGGRLGTAAEVADVVATLAGRDGAWVTGQAVSVSGGWAMY